MPVACTCANIPWYCTASGKSTSVAYMFEYVILLVPKSVVPSAISPLSFGGLYVNTPVVLYDNLPSPSAAPSVVLTLKSVYWIPIVSLSTLHT